MESFLHRPRPLFLTQCYTGRQLFGAQSPTGKEGGSFLAVGSGYICAGAVTALLHLQPLSLALEPLLTGLHQARRLSSDSSLPMSLWGAPWMGAPLPGYSLRWTRVSCLSLPILNLQKPFVEFSQCSFFTDAFALARPNNCRNIIKQNVRTVQPKQCRETGTASLTHTVIPLLVFPGPHFRKRSDLAAGLLAKLFVNPKPKPLTQTVPVCDNVILKRSVSSYSNSS